MFRVVERRTDVEEFWMPEYSPDEGRFGGNIVHGTRYGLIERLLPAERHSPEESFQASPDVLVGIQLRCVGRQEFDLEAGAHRFEVVRGFGRDVRGMAVHHEDDGAPDVVDQILEELDEKRRVEVLLVA